MCLGETDRQADGECTLLTPPYSSAPKRETLAFQSVCRRQASKGVVAHKPPCRSPRLSLALS